MEAERKIHHRDAVYRRFVAGNSASGFQGYCFVNEVCMFLTSIEMSLDLKKQTSRNIPTCFSTCLTVKGTEPHKVTTLQTKRCKNVSSRMWKPTKSVVVKPPDLEVKGTCLALDNKHRAARTVDITSPTGLVFLDEQNANLASRDVRTEQEDYPKDKYNGEDSSEGKILLALLESSLNKKLNPEYIDIIPSRLNHSSTGYRSPQFGNYSTSYFRYSPRLAIPDEILPMDLKFGIRNPKRLYSTAVLRRPEAVERPKTVLSFYRGKLEPLLPREKPAENLHEELEREEVKARTGTRSI